MPKPQIELTAAEWRVIKAVWKMYPPKAAIGIAAKFVVGQQLHSPDFSGGEGAGQANAVLAALGFAIVEKEMSGKEHW